MRRNGETPFPKTIVIESGKTFSIPSRDSGRDILCRVFEPESGQNDGVYMHIHGGGWVVQSEAEYVVCPHQYSSEILEYSFLAKVRILSLNPSRTIQMSL